MEEVRHTPKALLDWAMRNAPSDGSAQGHAEETAEDKRNRLMTHEEFQEFWKTTFPDELPVLKESLKAVQQPIPISRDEFHHALDKILFIVEGIDAADWFTDLDGFSIILPLLRNADDETRRAAAWIISHALQNNPKVMGKFDAKYSQEDLIAAIEAEKNEEVAVKMFGAISSAIRGYKPLRSKFYELHGAERLQPVCDRFHCLYFRFCWLIGAILDEEDNGDLIRLKQAHVKEFLTTHRSEIDDQDLLASVLSRLE